MSIETVLITGTTGYIGSLVLLKLVESGKRVRACVRSLARGTAIKEVPAVTPYAHLIEFVEVPDFEAPGAFDAVIQGCDAIIHLAAPIIREETDPNTVYGPMVNGTQSLVSAAHTVAGGKVKRVVLASTAVALCPIEAFANGDKESVYHAYSRLPTDMIPQMPFPHSAFAYQAAKASLVTWAEDFVKKQNPQFDVVQVFPSWVIGANPTFTRPEELLAATSEKVLSILLGAKGIPTAGQACSVNDVARIFTGALDETRIPGSASILVTTAGFAYNDALDIAKKEFPEAVENGLLPLGGDRQTTYTTFDATETEKIFGKLETFEESARSTIQQYLELVEKSGPPEIVTSGEYRQRVT